MFSLKKPLCRSPQLLAAAQAAASGWIQPEQYFSGFPQGIFFSPWFFNHGNQSNPVSVGARMLLTAWVSPEAYTYLLGAVGLQDVPLSLPGRNGLWGSGYGPGNVAPWWQGGHC